MFIVCNLLCSVLSKARSFFVRAWDGSGPCHRCFHWGLNFRVLFPIAMSLGKMKTKPYSTMINRIKPARIWNCLCSGILILRQFIASPWDQGIRAVPHATAMVRVWRILWLSMSAAMAQEGQARE